MTQQNTTPTSHPNVCVTHDEPFPLSDEARIGGLMDSESHHMPERNYLQRCRDRVFDTMARLDAINWILKVQAFYQFRPVTAFLSINYMDRFLSCSSLPRQSGWAFQLVSVACLSLAAKLEEPQVPLLLDLQLFQPTFVFEPKTVQRMELLVMANLNWRLRSVTPFDYLHYFITNLPSSSSSTQSQSIDHLFSRASDIIIATTRVIDFLGFAPSTVAAAAVLCSAGIVSGNSQLQLCFHSRLNKEKVRWCHQLMEEYVVDTCPHKGSRTEASPPSSPVAVLDAANCGSCDTPASSAGPTQTQFESDPPNKRLRFSGPYDVQHP